ncbi:DUF3782 domain-containing protein [Candidatus Synechococcus calcipolaris G9]|uniref:DUF3782 domain-containing protein n=1 Tax=Candidatus Synechococcus calcipolaris G9 TaxID=1497997 RepID=A0ABT6EYP4_9SYNE|nr:DUF3782 domain-containing protein [Candidatus Synechococcus calcipolaris]MDG2990258.1 DUF3782 domain-containing protein [Candidatus Synechococcus calcipolaris G9]
MTAASEEIWQILRELAASQRETDRQMQETDQKLQELAQAQRETDLQRKEQQRETSQQLRELGKQIGGLGAKFGSFTEGLALPSMEKILRNQFGMEVISPSVRVSKEGHHLELDVLAYANSDINAVYVVEVKSHARDESLTQLQTILSRFHQFFPEHRDKNVYGILAAVDMAPDLRERVLNAGIYVARIQEEVFSLDTPSDFIPRAY